MPRIWVLVPLVLVLVVGDGSLMGKASVGGMVPPLVVALDVVEILVKEAAGIVDAAEVAESLVVQHEEEMMLVGDLK